MNPAVFGQLVQPQEVRVALDTESPNTEPTHGNVPVRDLPRTAPLKPAPTTPPNIEQAPGSSLEPDSDVLVQGDVSGASPNETGSLVNEVVSLETDGLTGRGADEPVADEPGAQDGGESPARSTAPVIELDDAESTPTSFEILDSDVGKIGAASTRPSTVQAVGPTPERISVVPENRQQQ
ncbi:MAG: hypothetical protein QGG40_22140, partial [Myxococcota bacterium]|nr:hypothetical protein [Myxococcota bacterium]